MRAIYFRVSAALFILASMLLFTSLETRAGERHNNREKDWNWINVHQDVKDICAAYDDDFPFPPADLPTRADAKALDACDSDALYLGIGQPADPEMARKCAFVEVSRGDDAVFGGLAQLMEIYANGTGANRNLDLAINLACYRGGAPAEFEERVRHLLRLKRDGWQGHAFSFCDDITSGFMMGQCSARDEAVAKAKRRDRLGALMETWSAEEQAAFQKLRIAADRYFDARSGDEVDLSGSARGMLVVEERAALERGLVAALERLEGGAGRAYSDNDFKAADAELNRVYQQIQRDETFHWGSVTREQIRAVQRAWIPYRDAWVAFCRMRYPRVDAVSVTTRLTLERTEMLSGFIE